MSHHQNSDFLKQALATVQQGLSSMQALQAQTTQAHQKYLEVQAQAHKALVAMIQGSRQLPIADSVWAVPTAEPSLTASLKGADPTATSAVDTDQRSILKAPSGSAQQPPAAEVPAPGIKDQIFDHSIQKTVLGIVAELTGYPREMLGLDMDIESDLGIDSIKRVEILSAVEEKMPHLPKVTPDMLADLTTLGRICAYLGSADLPSREISESEKYSEPPPGTSAPAGMLGDREISQTVVTIVSELTGYPREMLGLDMDIESDLGIDSIKRVEILSAVEEKMPHLPKVTPDMLGDLKTLGQICSYLASGSIDQGALRAAVNAKARTGVNQQDEPMCDAGAFHYRA